MRLALIVILTVFLGLKASSQTAIRGSAVVSADSLAAFVKTVNPDFDPDIAKAFVEIGERYGIRGDIAICQAIVETGWFRFDGGTAVEPSQHNYCGLGVTQRGLRGYSFDTIEEGVTAMMQHLFAYATKEPLREEIKDPRFSLVTRGCAPNWEDLSNRWAANPDYGNIILKLYGRLYKASSPTLSAEDVAEDSGESAEVSHPDFF